MNLLPHWSITDMHPAFYDVESGTAIEQTARLYGAMQTLIGEYNQFADKCNKNITEFEQSTNQDIETFKVGMRQEFQDFIDTVDLHIQTQDNEIKSALTYIRNEVDKIAREIIIEELYEKGVSIEMTYNEETEELGFVLFGGAE